MKISRLNLFGILFFITLAGADELRDANRLLRASNVEHQFKAMAQQQTRNIIRTYSSIVAMSVDVDLPQWIKLEIAACYEQAFSWHKFEAGIAQILLENLSSGEMHLLINFYQSQGLPPTQIANFKAATAKGNMIQQLTANHIFENSEGCAAHDAELILGYLAEQRQQIRENLASE